MLKKLLTHKQEGSGTNNLLLGSMLILLLICTVIHETSYQRNTMAASLVSDSLTSSLLGAVLANPDEYGASNQLIMYDRLINTETTDESYNDYVKAVELDNEHYPYFSTYVFEEDPDKLTSLGNIASPDVDGDYGPLQSFETFEQLLKTNMGLDDNWVPKKSIYLPSKLSNGSANKVEVESYKVYNYFECLVSVRLSRSLEQSEEGSEDDSAEELMNNSLERAYGDPGIVDGLLDWNGNVVYTYSNDSPVFSSYQELKDNKLIFSKVVCYTIDYVSGTPLITNIEEFDWNEEVYVTDENNNRVKGEDGNDILVDASGLYAKISFNINLGVRTLNEKPEYSRVYKEQTVFIEPNREALESGKV